MATYFVSVAATRQNFLGDIETDAKTIRADAPDPIEAGESVLDAVVGGSRWMFSSARARVTSTDTGTLLAEVTVGYPKAFGVRRCETRTLWSLQQATH